MKIRKSYIILLIITLYGINYFVFERILFFNELLSLLGLFYFIKTSFKKDFKFYYPKNTIYRCVLFFIILSGGYAIASLWLKTNWYYYLRNTSIIYSAFTFFLGYHLYEVQFRFFEKIRTALYGYSLLAFSIGAPNLIDRNAYSFWFTLLQKNWKLFSVILLVLLYVLYVFTYTSLTVIMIMLVVFAMRYILKTYVQFKLTLLLGLSAFLIIFILAIPALKLYSTNEYHTFGNTEYSYSLFGNAEYVYSQHPWFRIDDNSSWRLIFWYRTLVEAFPNNLLGIGIGTPLLPYMPNVNTTLLPYNDEHVAHVIGTHNTFVTLFVRFGILSILLIAAIYRSVFREFFIHKQYYLQHRNDAGLFLSFVTLTVVGMFNLLIDTPTLAALYWVSLGFVAKAIFYRQNQNYEVQNM